MEIKHIHKARHIACTEEHTFGQTELAISAELQPTVEWGTEQQKQKEAICMSVKNPIMV